MMYLSHLMIDVGNNPDRPRPGRRWLRNAYRVHQRLCMAFPSKERPKKEADPEFLMPYSPDDFPEARHIADQKAAQVGSEALRHVHTPRDSSSGFLFRIDPLPDSSVSILVLSAVKPDWDYAFHNAAYLLAAPPSKPRSMELAIATGSQFHFRLTANPVRKVATIPRRCRERPDQPGRHGRRVPVPSEDFGKWLVARGEIHGFRLFEPLEETLRTQPGYVYVAKGRDTGKGQRLRSVRYDGLLEVVDVERFRKALLSGIGSAKAFGFGLLSIAPVNR